MILKKLHLIIYAIMIFGPYTWLQKKLHKNTQFSFRQYKYIFVYMMLSIMIIPQMFFIILSNIFIHPIFATIIGGTVNILFCMYEYNIAKKYVIYSKRRYIVLGTIIPYVFIGIIMFIFIIYEPSTWKERFVENAMSYMRSIKSV